jgi:ribonuclease E
MKKTLIAACIYSLVIAACGSNDKSESHDHGDATHSHENGTEHNHDSVKQDEFIPGKDSIADTTHAHTHDGEHDHHDHAH